MTRFGIHNATTTMRGERPDIRLSRTHRARHRVLCLAVTVLAGLYTLRLGYLQIIQGEEHRRTQLAQSAEWEFLQAPRGRIVDRHGAVLAAHDTRYQAFLAVDELRVDRAEAIALVTAVIDVSPERRRAVATAKRGWPLIASAVSDEEKMRLERSIGQGIRFESQSARGYPRGSMGRTLIGAVGSAGRGRTGLELALDALLRGQSGRAEVRFDGRRNAYRPPGGQIVEARAGHDVVLTIDSGLQRIAENELARALVETGARGGDIVLLDPRTGELLAVASDRKDAAPDRVPAFTDPYEPGSTLKPFLLASLLSEGLVDLDETVDVEGGVLRSGARVIHDVHGYDELTAREIIIKSSNVGAAKLSGRLTPAVQHRYLRDFGFGMRTQVGHLTESSGRLSRPDEWTSLSQASHAIGYEVSVTSLQLAAAYGAIANGGVLMQPTLVKEIRDADGRLVERFDPRPVRRVISTEVAAAVRDVLEEVVSDGTGALAQMASLSVAGKTGTARLAADGGYARGHYRALFVGFAPVDDPRIVILTRLEDPTEGSYYGGAIAAPTSQATLQAALAADGVQLDPRLVVSGAQPRRWSGRQRSPGRDGPFIFAVGVAEETWSGVTDGGEPLIALPNLTGLSPRSAAARLHELGLRVEWQGHKTVERQNPSPGTEVVRGQTVVLR